MWLVQETSLLWHEIYTKNAGNIGIARTREPKDFTHTFVVSKNPTEVMSFARVSRK